MFLPNLVTFGILNNHEDISFNEFEKYLVLFDILQDEDTN